ncbi:MAG: cupin domain-containing protein [Anaerolineales bacterium]|nr:MAG: cupin domain-containing protein [Anaerolineales bacterium]
MATAQKSQVLKLADLAAYQEGSVVSRQIVKADAGNVTLFAFDADQELSEHTAPYDALVHVLDGEAEVRLDGVPHALSAGDAIVMPANTPHALRAVKQFKMLLTMIRQ